MILKELLESPFLGCESVISVGSMRGKYLEDLPCARKIALDAHLPYLNDIRFECEKMYGDAIDLIPKIPDNSIDGVMAIDFIEHLTKTHGEYLLPHMERIAKKVVVIYTPKGFQAQLERNVVKLSGEELFLQTHRSGWFASDFAKAGYETRLYGEAIIAVLRKSCV